MFMTMLEFICAQAPLQMKGVLVSLWYSSQAVNFLVVGVPEVFINDSKVWNIYQSGKICLVFVSFVAYICVSKRYRYHHRDEVVNMQYLVEDVYEQEIENSTWVTVLVNYMYMYIRNKQSLAWLAVVACPLYTTL